RLAESRSRRFPLDRFVFSFGFQLIRVVIHDLAILGMDAQRKFRFGNPGKSFQANPVVGTREIADGCAKEDLVTNNAGFWHRSDLVCIGLKDDSDESEID